MILHREDRLGRVTKAFYRAVVEIQMRDANVGGQGTRIDGIAMMLRRDFHLPGTHLLYRMVRATVTELQLERLAADCEAEDLMPQADAEHRPVGIDELTDVVDGIRERRRVAGPVAEENTVRA